MAGELKNPDRHTTRSGMLTRPDPDLRTRVQAALKRYDWTADEFFIACMRLLLAYKTPKTLFDELAKYRPARKPRGRPKKNTD